MSCKGVIFDLDGTLLDTLEDLADCCNRALSGAGLPGHPLDAYRYFVGEGRERLVERVLPACHRNPDTMARVIDSFNAEYDQHWADKTRPFDGVSELLAELSRRSIPAAVVSNKPERFTRLCVSTLLGGHSFKAVIGARPDAPRKPDPSLAMEAARMMGVSEKDCIYVGDTDIDMQTATRAGMFPVGALWGFRSAEELRSSGAALLIARPADLIDLL